MDKKIEKIVSSTFIKLKNIQKFEKYTNKNNIFEKISEISSVIIFLSEADYINADEGKELTFEYLKLLKQVLEKYPYKLPICQFGGLSNIGLAVVAANKRYGGYEKFLLNITDYIIQECNIKLNEFEADLTNTKIRNFDFISGLAGVSNFLLSKVDYPEAKKCLIRILEYFVKLTDNFIHNDNVVPLYYIKVENQLTEDDKKLYPSGCVNFSLSHGISGILYSLSKTLKIGIIVEGHENTIRKIVNEIIDFSYIDQNGCVQFSGRVSLEEYLNHTKDIQNTRASWCYGSPGISSVLYLAGDVLDDDEIKEIAYQSILKICEGSTSDMRLDFPLICHGFAGVLAVTNFMNNKKNDIRLSNMSNTIRNMLIELHDERIYSGYYNSQFVKKNNEIEIDKKIDFSILEGSLGIILAIIHIQTRENLIWQQLIGLS